MNLLAFGIESLMLTMNWAIGMSLQQATNTMIYTRPISFKNSDRPITREKQTLVNPTNRAVQCTYQVIRMPLIAFTIVTHPPPNKWFRSFFQLWERARIPSPNPVPILRGVADHKSRLHSSFPYYVPAQLWHESTLQIPATTCLNPIDTMYHICTFGAPNVRLGYIGLVWDTLRVGLH